MLRLSLVVAEDTKDSPMASKGCRPRVRSKKKRKKENNFLKNKYY